MKLLIVTQAVDVEHPILGFFHRWIEEFAKNCEEVHVICLQEGKHSLPDNVKVYSLGKEKGVSRLTYLYRFYKLIWQLRHVYDNVFVHMNQIYVILGAPLWRIWSKKIGLWYAHGAVSNSLRIALCFTNKVFTSTEQGFRIDSRKRFIVGQGIDTDLFTSVERKSSDALRLITVGRISVSKNIDTLVNVCNLLKNKNINFKLKIIGLPTTESEIVYETGIKAKVSELQLNNHIEFVGPVTQSNLPNYLQNSDIFIHDGSTNSLDKALLEAVLCGCVVISSNPSYAHIISSLSSSFMFEPKDSNGLTKEVIAIQNMSLDERRLNMMPIYKFVKDNYSISNLISGIVTKY